MWRLFGLLGDSPALSKQDHPLCVAEAIYDLSMAL
jgi:hypothetical protein